MLFNNITMIGENYNAAFHTNIIVTDGRISYIGTELPQDYQGEIYNGEGKIAAPAFYNPHCHVPMTLLRGYGEGLPLDRWLFDKMFPFEALLTKDDIYWGALLGVAEMLRTGVASFTDMYFKIPIIAQVAHETGIKANISNGTTGTQQLYTNNNAYVETMDSLALVKNFGHDRVIVDAAIHAEYTSDEMMARGVAEFAQQNNLRIHLHLSETEKEHNESKTRRGMTPTKWFEHIGVFNSPVTAAHCVWVEDEDIDALAQYDVTPVHCPSSNLKLGSGIAPLRKMMNKGIRVAIGTDSAASNNNLNMLEEVNLAALVQKGIERDPLFLSMEQIFEMACRNGALAQGRPDCGAIKVGNKADIIVYDTTKPHMVPLTNPASNILYSAQSEDIVLTMVDGKVLYREGSYTTIDIEKVKYNAQSIVNKKLAQLNK